MIGIADLPDEDLIAEDGHLVVGRPSLGAKQLDCSTFLLDRADLA